MLIYRLENEEGEGCYERGYGFKCCRQTMNDNDASLKDHHPGPEDEPKLARFWAGFHLTVKEMRRWPDHGRRKWRCAFESLEQLEKWFPVDGLRRMQLMSDRSSDNMQLVVYRVPHHKVRKGDAQVVYNADHAEFVECLMLSELISQLSG